MIESLKIEDLIHDFTPQVRALDNLSFMVKRGWSDELSERLVSRKKESGFENRDDIQTMFHYIDADEGRM